MTRILLVEDEPDVRLSVSEHLRIIMKYDVNCATDGADALKWIEANGDPDVILLDLKMPVMDGREFIAAYGGKARIIVMSAYVADLDLGDKIFAIAEKPMILSEFRATIEDAARHRKDPG